VESNCDAKVIKIILVLLEQVINLLASNGEEQWAGFLQNAKNNLIEAKVKKDGVVPIVKSMLGGAGSLSDVVLHRDGKPLIEENNRLYDLLNELYDECQKIA
jgi:hypothetical protein